MHTFSAGSISDSVLVLEPGPRTVTLKYPSLAATIKNMRQ